MPRDPVCPANIGEALHRIRTDDPFLTMQGATLPQEPDSRATQEEPPTSVTPEEPLVAATGATTVPRAGSRFTVHLPADHDGRASVTLRPIIGGQALTVQLVPDELRALAKHLAGVASAIEEPDYVHAVTPRRAGEDT